MKCNAKEYLKLQKKVTLKEAKRQFAASRRQLGLEPIEKDSWKLAEYWFVRSVC